MEDVKIEKKCKTCNHRDVGKVCHSPFITEDEHVLLGSEDKSLVYSYTEGGWFEAGDNFCCIHWERK
ncbi:MAG: hypothetical protein ACC651_17400 [Candidatus Scalindua sp.]